MDSLLDAASMQAGLDPTPEPIVQVVARANDLGEAGAYVEALALLDRTIESRHKEPELHTARGWVLENLGASRLPGARRDYETAIALDAGQLWAHAGLAGVLGRLGEAVECARTWEKVIELAIPRAAQEPDLLELIGWSQYRLGRFDEAADTFQRALSRDEAWVSVRFDLGLALLARGDEDRALREYEAGISCLRQREPGRRMGSLLVALDDFDEALQRMIPSMRESRAASSIRARLVESADGDIHRG